MIAELNGLDMLVAGLQILVLASFFYFCYLVVRQGGGLRHPLPEAGWRSAPERTREAMIAMGQGEPEHGNPGYAPRTQRASGHTRGLLAQAAR